MTSTKTSAESVAGAELAVQRVPGFRLMEVQYARGLELARHAHQNARLTYVLEGTYTESYEGSWHAVCAPGTLRYLPAGHAHASVFESGARCLIVEIQPEALARVSNHHDAWQQPFEIRGIASSWLAQRLHQEFRQGDPLALVSVEGLLLEILADGARHAGESSPERVIPRWLRVAREYLEANFLRPLSLAEVAEVAGVHRVHLSREFRRHFSTTVGEFLRRKRIEHACQLVSKTTDPLADVAMSCGFSDQSHFSATFRRQIGLTPGRFRQMAQSR